MRLLLKLWPVLIPVVLYLAWHAYAKAKAKREGKTPPTLREGPWIWIIASMLAIAVILLLSLGLSTKPSNDGTYVPAHLEDGKLIPGKMEPTHRE